MTSPISHGSNSQSTEALFPAAVPSGIDSGKGMQKIMQSLTRLFQSIWPLRAQQDPALSERKIPPAILENSQLSASVLADLAEVARDFEEMEALWKTIPSPPPPFRSSLTKDTRLQKEQVSISEKTWIEGLYFRKEGETFNQAFLVTDYTVLCFTVFYPDSSIVNLECCFPLTSLALEYLARLSNLEVLDLSYCFSKKRTVLWRPAKDDSLDKKPSLLTPLAKCTHLHTLKLSCCSGLEDEDLQDLPSLTQLKCLDLSYCSKLTAKSVELIAQLPQLQKLILVECDRLRIAEKALLDMCSKCTTLEEIDFTDIGFYPEFASELVSKMPSVKKGIILGSEYPPINTFRRIEECHS